MRRLYTSFRCFKSYAAAAFLLLATLFFPAQNAFATVNCPEDVIVELAPGSCSVIIDYSILQWSSTTTIVDTIFLPGHGTAFPAGTTSVTMITRDVFFVFNTCVFNVTIVEDSSAVPCLTDAYISLQGQCERTVNIQELLNPNAEYCAGSFEVSRLVFGGVTTPPTINANDLDTPLLFFIENENTGNTCETTVHVTGGTPPSITCPPGLVIFCNEPLDSSHTGSPTLTGCYEDIQLTYMDDLETTNCADSFAFQLVRTWISTDPFGKQDTCPQFITARKFNIQLVQFPTDMDGSERAALLCSDSTPWETLTHPEHTGYPTFMGYSPAASPFCKITVLHTDFTTFGCGNTLELKRVWKVVKTCPPFTTLQDTQVIRIADPAGPQFQIPDTIFASLSPDCPDSIIQLPAAHILFECSSFGVTITTPWDTLNNNGGPTEVELIGGTYPILYRLTDECGNVSEQTTMLQIDSALLVSCPPNDTVFCDYYTDTLAVAVITQNPALLASLGFPVFHGNCDFNLVEVDTFAVNTCGNGFVRRTMTTTNASTPISCVQYITVQHASDFEVAFPANISLCTNPAPEVAGEPQLFNLSCEDVDTDFTDAVVEGTIASKCYTLRRTWKIKNTCNFSGDVVIEDPQVGERRFADGGDGYLEYVQTIKVNNGAKPVFTNGCSLSALNVPANACTVTFTLPSPAVSGCGTPALALSGELDTIPGVPLQLSAGSYDVNWLAVDSCGNQQTCSTVFEVRDVTPPTVFCGSTIVALTPGMPPSVLVYAQGLISGSLDNCPAPLSYSFSALANQPFRVFECGQLGQNSVTVYAKDGAGNQVSCQANVTVVAPAGVCQSTAPIEGFIENEAGIGVGQVTVQFSSGNDFMTLSDGSYQYDPPFPDSLLITPVKNINPANGVTTFDLVLLTKHILGVQSLTSAYQLIAADANASGSVTTFDAVEIRRLILGVTTGFANTNSWRFVPKNFVFQNPPGIFLPAFPEFILLTQPMTGNENLDFIGIKIGDLNGNADPGQ